MDELNPYCKEKFDTIERRLNSKSDAVEKHETEIEVLKTDLSHLTKSLNALTKALWGISGTIISALFGFFVWYVQSQ